MKAYRGRRGTGPVTCNGGTEPTVVRFTPRPLYPPEKKPAQIYSSFFWGGGRSGSFGEERNLFARNRMWCLKYGEHLKDNRLLHKLSRKDDGKVSDSSETAVTCTVRLHRLILR